MLEHGVIKLGELAEVNDHQPGWKATTNQLKRLLNQDYKTLTVEQQGRRPMYEQMYALVHALQIAWRNKVSHAQNKLVVMTSDFSADVAEEILLATRAFMRRLATDLGAGPPLN